MGLAKHVRGVSPRVWFRFKLLRYKYYNGDWEIWLVRHLVTKGKLAIDIGASIGVYTSELAKYAARVVAFEPNPRLADFARQVLSSNVEVKNVALSAANVETTLRIPLDRRNSTIDDLATVEPKNVLHFDAVASVRVMTRRLDDFGFENCGFIKIDVEGHEEAVLDGAMRLIETQKPILMIEIDDGLNPGSFFRVDEQLRRLNYKAYHFVDGHLQPADHDGLKLANFIFVADGAALPSLTPCERFAIAARSRLHR
jgi:FkbM family methyltransferase